MKYVSVLAIVSLGFVAAFIIGELICRKGKSGKTKSQRDSDPGH
jgi:hypothetical protein